MRRRSCRIVAIASLAVLLGACSGGAGNVIDAPPEPVVYPEPATPQQGSLFQARSPVALFVDQRARAPGDVLTIVLQEATQARTSSSTATNKASDISLPNPTLFGLPVTRNGVPILDVSASTDNSFSGGGSSEQANQLDGFITAQVLEVTPNGLLRVRGEKRLRINRGDETIVLTGLVRPQDIGPDNTVASLRVADADIAYRGRGALGQVNQQGWLGRFFNSPLWPF